MMVLQSVNKIKQNIFSPFKTDHRTQGLKNLIQSNLKSRLKFFYACNIKWQVVFQGLCIHYFLLLLRKYLHSQTILLYGESYLNEKNTSRKQNIRNATLVTPQPFMACVDDLILPVILLGLSFDLLKKVSVIIMPKIEHIKFSLFDHQRNMHISMRK